MVDIVVHTHLHADHVGHNLAADGKPNFPNATYQCLTDGLGLLLAALSANPQMQQVVPLNERGAGAIFR